MVSPSCPALVIHDDDAFRKSLIATLDQEHFTVTVSTTDPRESIAALQSREFKVILLAVDVATGKGMQALEYLSRHRTSVTSAIIVVGEANPDLRTHAKAANETLLKPVDARYLAGRARAYCAH